jgi:hypothetical protein
MCDTLIAGIERDGLLDSFAIDDIDGSLSCDTLLMRMYGNLS